MVRPPPAGTMAPALSGRSSAARVTWVPRLGRITGISSSSCSSSGRMRSAAPPAPAQLVHAEDVVHVEPEAEHPARRLVVEGGHHQLEGSHEVRCELDHELPLEQRLAHESEVELLQVAQAAMDELGGAAARS